MLFDIIKYCYFIIQSVYTYIYLFKLELSLPAYFFLFAIVSPKLFSFDICTYICVICFLLWYNHHHTHAHKYISERNGCGDTIAKDGFVRQANIDNTTNKLIFIYIYMYVYIHQILLIWTSTILVLSYIYILI